MSCRVEILSCVVGGGMGREVVERQRGWQRRIRGGGGGDVVNVIFLKKLLSNNFCVVEKCVGRSRRTTLTTPTKTL